MYISLMKAILTTLFIFISALSFSQKYALIDRDFKKPILFTDSVTINQVSNNYFPIKVTDLDSLVANLEYIQKQLGNIQRSKFKSYRLQSGTTNTKVSTVPHAYGDAYDITLLTNANNVNAEYLLVSNVDMNKKAVKKISKFISFIQQDKSIVIKKYKEFEAVLLDATIYVGKD